MSSFSKPETLPGVETPRDRYRHRLASRDGLQADPAQAQAVERLQRVFNELQPAPQRPGWWGRWRKQEALPPRGLYLWGPVGRGKTMLMDLFCEALPAAGRQRLHFHSFMRAVHAELKTLERVPDPLITVARRWAGVARVLCLDEFHVTDITDAMLLGRLLRGLLDAGVTVVTTSNEPPSRLYWNGLQRERFLPAIALLEQRLEVLELAGPCDYRLRTLEQAAVYYVIEAGQGESRLRERFVALSGDPDPRPVALDIEGRDLPVRAAAHGVVWCDFDELCGGPRGTTDYIELGRCFHTLLLQGVPLLGEDDNDATRRFINLIDEIYDRSVKLLVTAAAPPDALYRGQKLAGLFRRTVSRLSEMASHDYLARPHLSR